jgi:hypothetical protein
MSELNELIEIGVLHATESDKCPFCPLEPPPDFTSHPGEDNDSTILGDIMVDPSVLVSRQSGARPKTGQANQQAQSSPQPKPQPIFTTVKEGGFSCEAHHLISGKQALAAGDHGFEQWIVASFGTIAKDTGYSVNNADNGLWAPSIPEKFKNGNWGPMSYDDKYAIAKQAMAAGHPQFHKGHHAIRDPDDLGEERHKTYDGYLKGMLKAMNDRMWGWSGVCPRTQQGKAKPYQPSVRANQALDNLSKVVRRKISAPATGWEIFISKYALRYHKDGICLHGTEM